MDHLSMIKLSRSMDYQELQDAVEQNSRCEIIEGIDRAIEDAGYSVPKLKALCYLKGEAKNIDFQDYEGDRGFAEDEFEARVDKILEST
jgi:hypothetical protein